MKQTEKERLKDAEIMQLRALLKNEENAHISERQARHAAQVEAAEHSGRHAAYSNVLAGLLFLLFVIIIFSFLGWLVAGHPLPPGWHA